jgi:hypothetical protein
MNDPVIRMSDLRAGRMCSRGARAFAERHNLDWQDFLRNGIPASKLEATGDAMIIKIVEAIRGRQQQ